MWLKLIAVIALLGGGYLIYLDAIIQNQFEGKRWQVPAKVYSRPLEIFTGATVSREQLIFELHQLHYRPKPDPQGLRPGSYHADDNRVAFHTRGFDFWDGDEPASQVTVHYDGSTIRDVVVNGRGDEIARLEPVLVGGIYPAHNEDRILVSLDQVPSALIGALIAVEDRDFYEHWGISLRGIARALFANIKAGGLRQGGSTLTQQLVKNFYLSSERTLTRKINEALMAVLLDFHYEKDDILAAYLNEVYLGQAGQRAIHGFGLASLFYFGVPLRELEVQQIALLVGLVKGPSWYDPRRNPERALERRTQVLLQMVEQGVMGQAEYDRVKDKPLGVIAKPVYQDESYPAFMTLVRKQLQQDYRDEDLRSEGLRIFTTIDPYVQQRLQHYVESHLASVRRGYGEKYDALQSAALFTSANTGEIVALVGDRNPRYKGFNRALDAYRPIGSLIKPAVYLAALEQGYTLATLVQDEPLEVETPNGKIWRPENFEKESHGDVLLMQALANSYNQATARVALDVGIGRVADTVERLGVEKDLPEVPALSLGAVSLSPFEVATMYQTFAAGGFYTPLRAIRSVLDASGKPLQRYGIDVEKRVEPALNYLITTALQEVVKQGTAKTARHYLPESLQLAGKTGTSDEQRDAWFAGWSGNYLGVVWVGFDNNLATQLTGATGALPIWAQTMASLPQQPLQPVTPESVEWHWIDAKQMALSRPHCDGAVYVPLAEGTVPDKRASCSETGRVFNWIRNLFGD
ncbi:MAG: penicillin-binding protein 1B [Ketobacteraceae bacterium]|nr:penicillin-binding protein 1B [Ketobacteraceae bacterium]